jgi:hypothetical protein
LATLTTWLVNLLAHLPLANSRVPSPNGAGSRASLRFADRLARAQKKIHLAAAMVVALVSLGATGAYWWVNAAAQ